MSYIWNEIENKSWHKVLSEELPYQYPKSVCMRCQPPTSEFLMQPCPSFSLYAFPIYPNQEVANLSQREETAKKDTYRLCFAFEKDPLLADPNNTKFKRIDGKNPVIVGEYVYNGLKYTFTYYSNPFKKHIQEVTTIEIKIENIGLYETEATIRLKPSITNNYELYYHYIVYHWNNDLWPKRNDIKLSNDYFYLKDKCIGKIVDSNMDYSLEDSYISTADRNYYTDNRHIYQFALYQRPELILNKIENTIKFTKKLQKGETSYIKLNCVNNYDCEDNNLNKEVLKLNTSIQKEIEIFENLHKNKAQLNFKDNKIEDIYYSQINTIHQLCIDLKDYWLPSQGGVDERHFMWLWEAYCMLDPLINLGYFHIVKKALEYILSMQDSPYKPDGRFTDLDGAIGTTGPRWVSTTGAALAFATKYYNFTKDEEFKNKYLDCLVNAGKWIIRQIKSTRLYDEKGEKVLWFGLMPWGRMNDDDYGYGITISDSITYKGLNELGKLLKNINHPLAGEFEAEAKLYFNDIETALERTQRVDGFILRLIPTEDMHLGTDFETVDGPLNIIHFKACNPNTEVMKRYINYYENHNVKDYFTGMINGNTVYTGMTELMLQEYYIETGQYKKAWKCWYMASKYGTTQDTFEVQERYCLNNPNWIPWQPNGSGSGRLLQMIINGIYYETEDKIILFGGFPYEWLMENGTTEFNNLLTEKGKVSIKAEIENNKIKVTLKGDFDRNKEIILQDNRFYIE